MRTIANVSAIIAATTAFSGSGIASAEDRDDRTPLFTQNGMALTLGGGFEDFTSSAARGATGTAGSWDLRLELGTQHPFSLEGGYMGSAQNIDGLTGTQSGTLMGTTLEGVIKGNLPTGTILRPFAFAGLGWRRYDVANAAFSTSDVGIADSDNLIVFPMGFGLAMDYRGVDADLRFTFRPAGGEAMISDPGQSNGFAPMHTIAFGARVGANF